MTRLVLYCISMMGLMTFVVVPSTNMMWNNINFVVPWNDMLETNEIIIVNCIVTMRLMTHWVVRCTRVMDTNDTLGCSFH